VAETHEQQEPHEEEDELSDEEAEQTEEQEQDQQDSQQKEEHQVEKETREEEEDELKQGASKEKRGRGGRGRAVAMKEWEMPRQAKGWQQGRKSTDCTSSRARGGSRPVTALRGELAEEDDHSIQDKGYLGRKEATVGGAGVGAVNRDKTRVTRVRWRWRETTCVCPQGGGDPSRHNPGASHSTLSTRRTR
jgi:hypothetical protein